MTLALGMVRPGSTIYIPFASYDKDDGSSITLTGLAVTDIEVYKDGGTTQQASDASYTLLDTDGIDFDALTGIHGFSINLADNTTAGFWSAGSKYFAVVSAVTIDAVAVSFIAATFEIGIPSAVLNTTIASLASQTSFTLTAGPAEDDALNGAVVYIHDVASAVQGGYATVLDYTGATKTVTLAAGTTFTAAATDNISVFPPAGIQSAAGVLWGSGAITAGVIATDAIGDSELAADAVTAIQSGLSTAAELAKVPKSDGTSSWNGTALAALQSEANDALVAYDPPTRAEATTDVNSVLAVLGALNDAAADGAVTTTDTVVSYLKQLINTLEGAPGLVTWPAAAAPANGVSIAEAVRYLFDQVGVAGANLTAADDAVIAAIPSAATVADAVWDEAIAGHVAAGSTGEALGAAGAAGDPWITALPGAYGAGSAGKIVGDNINATVSSRASQTSVDDLPTNAELATSQAAADDATLAAIAALNNLSAAAAADAVWDEDATAHQTGGTFGQAIGDPGADTNTIFKATVTDAAGATVGVDMVAVKADTAAIGAAGAGLTAVPWNASWDAEVQSEVQDALDAAVPDSIPADGSRPSIAQAAYLLTQFMMERAVLGTTLTIHKPDGTTALMTLTLDDGTLPSAITRAT